MLFGSRAPLWKYILGIVTLSAVAHRAAAGVMIHLSGGPVALVVAFGAQVLAGLVVAAGLFADRDRWVKVGLIAVGIALLGRSLTCA